MNQDASDLIQIQMQSLCLLLCCVKFLTKSELNIYGTLVLVLNVMSSRALKRLQKEQLSAIAPEKSDEEVVDSEEEDHVQGKPIKQINPFDLVSGSKQPIL